MGVEIWRDLSPLPIAKVKIEGMKEALKKFDESVRVRDPKVKVQIELSESGLLKFKNAFAFFEIKHISESAEKDSLKDTVLNFFGSKGDKDKESGEDTKSGEGKESKSTKKPRKTPEPRPQEWDGNEWYSDDSIAEPDSSKNVRYFD